MGQDEPVSEEKSSRSYWGFVVWPFVALVLYLFSIGPVALAVHKRVLPKSVFAMYTPLSDAVQSKVVVKVVRMYLHWWVPDVIDAHGNLIGTL